MLTPELQNKLRELLVRTYGNGNLSSNLTHYVKRVVGECIDNVLQDNEEPFREHHLVQLINSKDREAFLDSLAELEWFLKIAKCGYHTTFGGPDDSDLHVALNDRRIDIDVYRPKSAFFKSTKWNDQLVSTFLKKVNAPVNYGVFHHMNEQMSQPQKVGSDLAELTNAIEPAPDTQINIHRLVSDNSVGLFAKAVCLTFPKGEKFREVKSVFDFPTDSVSVFVGKTRRRLSPVAEIRFDHKNTWDPFNVVLSGPLQSGLHSIINLVHSYYLNWFGGNKGAANGWTCTIRVRENAPPSEEEMGSLLEKALNDVGCYALFASSHLIIFANEDGIYWASVTIKESDNYALFDSPSLPIWLDGRSTTNNIAEIWILPGTDTQREPQVLMHTGGGGCSDIHSLSKSLEKKVKQLKDGLFAVTASQSDVHEFLVQALLGTPAYSFHPDNPANGSQILDTRTWKSQGLFYKNSRVHGVLFGAVNHESGVFEVWGYAPNPLSRDAVCDQFAESAGVKTVYEWDLDSTSAIFKKTSL